MLFAATGTEDLYHFLLGGPSEKYAELITPEVFFKTIRHGNISLLNLKPKHLKDVLTRFDMIAEMAAAGGHEALARTYYDRYSDRAGGSSYLLAALTEKLILNFCTANNVEAAKKYFSKNGNAEYTLKNLEIVFRGSLQGNYLEGVQYALDRGLTPETNTSLNQWYKYWIKLDDINYFKKVVAMLFPNSEKQKHFFLTSVFQAFVTKSLPYLKFYVEISPNPPTYEHVRYSLMPQPWGSSSTKADWSRKIACLKFCLEKNPAIVLNEVPQISAADTVFCSYEDLLFLESHGMRFNFETFKFGVVFGQLLERLEETREGIARGRLNGYEGERQWLGFLFSHNAAIAPKDFLKLVASWNVEFLRMVYDRSQSTRLPLTFHSGGLFSIVGVLGSGLKDWYSFINYCYYCFFLLEEMDIVGYAKC